ncbi:TM1812 family CRISPR-associated protein [Methylomonas paludis]|uniref:TM1812 family CRISPR-associated protein n=1 Tax=Methylomonas paludis TaxID=1173101 RepID=A0A975MQL1_9GAMM|nr:hypothetical protein [Methylomonas paludis]QWF71954.1 TM1812 family CRISPR-associated protein [Methylomonas paludis]
MTDASVEILSQCQRHADRLQWAMQQLQPQLPFSAATLPGLSDMELAVLDQFSTRFSKLQDLMGAKLFPAVLELTKEPGELNAFIDKLNRLEKIGAIPSADDWLLLREIRNAFAHDYPENPDLQAEILNKAYGLAGQLLAVLDSVSAFAQSYLK